MNKKLFFGLAATFAVAIAAVCVTLALNNTSSKYSALQAANIEALSQKEYRDGDCVQTVSTYETEDFCGGAWTVTYKYQDYSCSTDGIWKTTKCWNGWKEFDYSCSGMELSNESEGDTIDC